DEPSLGRTNYVGVGGVIGRILNPWDVYEGVFISQSKVTVATIADGSSNTLMFGETLGDDIRASNDSSFAWMGMGYLVTGYGLPPDGAWYTFGSKHQVVNFAYADGSVHGVRKSAAVSALYPASGIQDGEVYPASELSN